MEVLPGKSTASASGLPLRAVAGDLEEPMPDDLSALAAHVVRTLARGAGPAR